MRQVFITAGYTIAVDEQAVGGKTITCHACKKTSYSPGDVGHLYCGNCCAFHLDVDTKGSKSKPRRRE